MSSILLVFLIVASTAAGPPAPRRRTDPVLAAVKWEIRRGAAGGTVDMRLTGPLAEPTLEVRDRARAEPRPLALKREGPKGAWLASLDGLDAGADRHLRLAWRDANGTPRYRFKRLAVTGIPAGSSEPAHSANGELTCWLAPDTFSDLARVLVASDDQLPAPLPDRLALLGGPHEILPLADIGPRVDAIVAFEWPVDAPLDPAPRLRRFDRERAAWLEVPAGVDRERRVITARIDRFGTFVLTGGAP